MTSGPILYGKQKWKRGNGEFLFSWTLKSLWQPRNEKMPAPWEEL